jgi:hypothetical protein
LGIAGVLARTLRRPAEGLRACLRIHRKECQKCEPAPGRPPAFPARQRRRREIVAGRQPKPI